MSDLTTAAPAGASEQSPIAIPTDRAAAADLLGRLDDFPVNGAEATPPEESQVTESSGEEPAEAAGEEPEEAQEPQDEPSEDGAEGTEAESEEEQYVHGNARTRLRDGTVTTVGELKKFADEVKEYRAHIPDLAAKAQEIQQRQAQLATQEQHVQQTLPLALHVINALVPPMPSPELRQTDPIGYFNAKDDHENGLRYVQQLQNAMQAQEHQTRQQQEAARAALIQEHVAREAQALREKLPEISDPVKGPTLWQQFVDLALESGYDQQDVGRVDDHRLFVMVNRLLRYREKAEAYDKLMAQKNAATAKVGDAPPVQKPGRRVSQEQAAQAAVNEQFKRWRDNGSDREGAAAILANL